MCTIGFIKLEHTYIFKNRDPIRGTSFDEWIEPLMFETKRFLIIKNQSGCYGGYNQEGVGIVGTFVNMSTSQNNYFDGNNLIRILSQGCINNIKEYLFYNTNQYYGNLICSDGISSYAFELNGREVNCLSIKDQYVMTNHFQQIKKPIRTISDEFIKLWTEGRLRRGRELIKKVNSLDGIKEFLSDHNGYPNYSICNHGHIHTATSYIIDCTDNKILYCTGNPCENEYIEYKLI